MVCGNPGKIEHGRFEGGNFNYNDQVNYKCDKGYKLYGKRQRTCLESGNWSGYSPKCKRINTSKYLYNITESIYIILQEATYFVSNGPFSCCQHKLR